MTRLFPPLEGGPLQVGDVLTRLDGEDIDASGPAEARFFESMVRRRNVGARTRLDLLRGGKPMTVEVVLPATPEPSADAARFKDDTFQYTARDLTVMDRITHRLPETLAGVHVEEVLPGGWAALASLKVGDVIVTVDGLPVPSVAVLAKRMSEICRGKPEAVVFFIRRGLLTVFLEARPDWTATGP